MPEPHPLVRGLLMLTLSRPSVDVTPTTLVVALGWTFRVAVPRGAITAAEQTPARPISIGAHGWRGRWLVNTATAPLVRVTIEPAARGHVLGVPVRIRELTLSIADTDAFLSDLR